MFFKQKIFCFGLGNRPVRMNGTPFEFNNCHNRGEQPSRTNNTVEVPIPGHLAVNHQKPMFFEFMAPKNQVFGMKR